MSTAPLSSLENNDRAETMVNGGDPGDRGTPSVADRVVERVAGHAAMQADAAAAPWRVLGVNLGESRQNDDVHVRAKVDGHSATVQATIAVRWPASIREVAEQTRRRIREDVAAMTDIAVEHIDIDVVSLNVPSRTTPRVR